MRVGPATSLRKKAKAKKKIKPQSGLDHLLLVDNLQEQDQQVKEANQRVKSWTTTHKKA